MKLLSSTEILKAVQSGHIGIEPFLESNLKPASYILRLDNKWRMWNKSKNPIDIFEKKHTEGYLSDTITNSNFRLDGRGFCLAATQEKIQIPNDMAAFIFPISHIARFGLNVNLGSTFISPGFGDTKPTALTLEIASNIPSKVILRSGCPIAHLIFIPVSDGTKLSKRIRSVFEGQVAPSSPAIWKEWTIKKEEN